MKRFLLGIFIILLVVSGTSVWAQSGGGFDLSWSTIDGGGGSSSGGDYSLSGTIGQSDAGTMAGGSYVLNGGFWNGACAAPVTTIGQAAGNVVLSWSSGSYFVYRGTNDPYFNATTPYSAGAVTSGWQDIGATGDPANNYFYRVGSLANCGGRTGEFDFNMTPGS
jgi:hypothetical protein